jgi:hypothetical protein
MLNFYLESEMHTSLYLPNIRPPQAYGALVPTKNHQNSGICRGDQEDFLSREGVGNVIAFQVLPSLYPRQMPICNRQYRQNNAKRSTATDTVPRLVARLL